MLNYRNTRVISPSYVSDNVSAPFFFASLLCLQKIKTDGCCSKQSELEVRHDLYMIKHDNEAVIQGTGHSFQLLTFIHMVYSQSPHQRP